MPQHALICRVRTWLCALPLAHVVETLRPLPVRGLAGAPSFVLGLALLRGQAVPVVDAAQLLIEAGLPALGSVNSAGQDVADAAAGQEAVGQAEVGQAGDWQTGLGEAPQRFVSITAGERRLALAVDAVLGLRLLDRGSLQALPPLLQQADAGFIDRVGLLDNELLLMLNQARLVPESIWATLQAAEAPAAEEHT